MGTIALVSLLETLSVMLKFSLGIELAGSFLSPFSIGRRKVERYSHHIIKCHICALTKLTIILAAESLKFTMTRIFCDLMYFS